MTIIRRVVALAAVVAVLAIGPLAIAAEKGWFGLSVSVDTEGLSFNPALRSITVDKVVTASPAFQAGLAPGDVVVEIQGIPVAGAKADTVKAAMQQSVGQVLRLKIKRGAAEPHDVSLIAAPKPAE